MTLPAVDRVKANYPEAEITAVTSPKTESFLGSSTFIERTVFFDKKWGAGKKIEFCRSLRGKFDLIADFKNSMLPFFLKIKRRTPYFRRFSKNEHSAVRYLKLLKKIAPHETEKKGSFAFSQADGWGLSKKERYLFLAPFSSSAKKEYPGLNLEKVIEGLKGQYSFVLLGLEGDRKKINQAFFKKNAIDLTGKTKILDLFYLLQNYAHCLLAVDSSIMHIASYLNLPVVGLFGPTDPARYGPYSKNSFVLQRKSLDCVPCQKKECAKSKECMDISPKEVIRAVTRIS